MQTPARTTLKVLALSLLFAALAYPIRAARPWPDSSSRILVFADQLPGSLTAAQRQFAATHLAGTQKMLRSDIRALRAYNANFLCLHYQLALGCGAHNFIVGDDWTSDWSYVNSQESWFLHNASSQRAHQAAWDWDVMDITYTGGTPNSGFPQYWIATALERLAANEDDGVFADSFTVDGVFDQCNPSHTWLSNVDQCLANWIPSLMTYGAAIKNALDADGRGYLFLPNLGGLVTGWDTTDYGVGHGGMIEAFCFWEQNSYFDIADWQLQMERALSLVRSNKIVICQSYINSADNTSDRLFALGAYLLIKGNRTYLNLLATGDLEFYPEYTLTLGAAVNAPGTLTNLWYAPWQVYRRDYANGLVLVNPDAAPVVISSLGANYQLVAVSGGGSVNESGESSGTVSLSPVTALTLAAHSGAILLSAQPAVERIAAAADFDGDRFADPTLVTNGHWLVWFSGNGYQRANPFVFEADGSTPVAADFDGDGRGDPAMCQTATGNWTVDFSSSGYLRQVYASLLGAAGAAPLAADFDGDGRADPAIYEEGTGNWSVLFSGNGYTRADFPGLLGGLGSQAVAADFDGDFLGDPAIYTPAAALFTARLSSIGYAPVTLSLE